jgi:polyisoprenoid-binding protein YceI
MNRKLVALSLAAAGLLVAGSVDARTFKVTPDSHSNTEVSFTSKASVVRLVGRTAKVEGFSEIDIDNPAKTNKGEISVDLTSLDTGIALRNEHMIGLIEAKKYPKATFKVKTINASKLIANEGVEGTATGDFSLHGVTKPLSVPITLHYLPEDKQNPEYRPGDWVSFSSNFKIKLSDYGIPLPKPMFGIKVADDLTIQVDGMAKGI